MERHNFAVVGLTYRRENLEELAEENYDYSLSRKEIAESFSDGDVIPKYNFSGKIELVPEPDNPHDPDAIRVDLNKTTIGYIKRGITGQVRNLMARDDYQGAKLRVLKYGPVKEVNFDDEDKLVLNTYERAPYAEITILNGEKQEVFRPKQQPPKKKKAPVALIFCTVVCAILFLVGLLLIFASPVTGIIIAVVSILIYIYARIYYGGRP